MHYTLETMGAVRLVHHGKNATAAAVDTSSEKCSNDPGRPGHQLFLLRLFLECLHYPSLLVVQDNARLAPDALAYFAGVQWLLSSDPTLWCLSGGSSIGAAAAAADPSLLLRTDAAPGSAGSMGWLVSRDVGLQVLAHWRAVTAASKDSKPPQVADSSAGWSRFLWSKALRRGRQCVVPELPRLRSAAAAVETASSSNSSHSGKTKSSSKRKGSSSGSDDSSYLVPPTPFELAAAASKAAASQVVGSKQFGGVDWMHADVSWLMEPHYSAVILEVRVVWCLGGLVR